jgi:hypothetical protein
VSVSVVGDGDGDAIPVVKRRKPDADGARHFAIARGSAMACAAVIDVVRVLGAMVMTDTDLALELLSRMVAM